MTGSATKVVVGSFLPDEDGYGPVSIDPLPKRHGTVSPVGIGDLLVVRQQLKAYEAAEIAYVENVLRSESMSRETRRFEKTEQTVLVETENLKEEERDLQSTDRFSLQRESSNTVKSDASLKAGVALSGSYGPTVEMKAYVDAAQTSSQEEINKQSSSFAKDVTSRAASKISEKVHEQRVQINVVEFEEKARHGFDNTAAGSSNISGVYQWLDKIYEVQVFNYGPRTLYDIVVPEPGSFLIHAARLKLAEQASSPKQPPPFTYTPDQISEDNYLAIGQSYGATSLDPPPLEIIQVSKAYDEKAVDANSKITKSEVLTIEPGYAAYAYYADGSYTFQGTKASLDIMLGYHRGWSGPLDGQVGTIPLAIWASNIVAYAIELEILCQRTERAWKLWQAKTHAALFEAYMRLQTDYERALSAVKTTPGPVITGQNPNENRAMERAELKKACLNVLTNQYFDKFGAIGLSTQGYPQPSVWAAAIQGKYIRFFEQAFEWDQMTYFHYPYFWADKDRWLRLLFKTDVDPLFRAFLQAGATRVVFSVRPGFDQAVAHFMETGEIWEGGDPPSISSELYVSIINEIKDAQSAPQTETPQGEPWDVRLPTTLVKLRTDDSLPEWKKDQNGKWAPV